jgi:hypothetical protein
MLPNITLSKVSWSLKKNRFSAIPALVGVRGENFECTADQPTLNQKFSKHIKIQYQSMSMGEGSPISQSRVNVSSIIIVL